MRSRYSAFALGLVDFLLASAHPGGPHRESTREELRAYCRAVSFEGLRIMGSSQPEGDVGTVTFRAQLSQDGEDLSFSERSTFLRHEGRWLYHDGERIFE